MSANLVPYQQTNVWSIRASWLRYWPTLLSLLLYPYFPMVTPRGLLELHWIALPGGLRKTAELRCVKHGVASPWLHVERKRSRLYFEKFLASTIHLISAKITEKSLSPFIRLNTISKCFFEILEDAEALCNHLLNAAVQNAIVYARSIHMYFSLIETWVYTRLSWDLLSTRCSLMHS